MKRFICSILTLTLLMIIGSVSFAATGDVTIPDPQVPGAPTVNSTTYNEQTTVIIDEDTPGGSVKEATSNSVEIKEEVPAAPAKLPKTGGIPAEAFYVAGALIIVAALVLSRVKTKAAPKN